MGGVAEEGLQEGLVDFVFVVRRAVVKRPDVIGQNTAGPSIGLFQGNHGRSSPPLFTTQ
ncbi:hypothetical protein D3C85_1841290 [compost metagenome]